MLVTASQRAQTIKTTHQNVLDATKEMVKGTYIPSNINNKKSERSVLNQ